VRAGAGVIMVDTADLADHADVHTALTRLGLRQSIRLAFGGGVRLQDLGPAAAAGADAVDVGRAILDAPLLDLRMRVCSRFPAD
jgi:nicotinate-nucleotide pyrophosphorylase (carboxylating)